MRKWISVAVVVALAISLVGGVFAHGVAGAKSPKAQDQVNNFIKAAAGLKAAKAASYWVPEERDNVTAQLNSIPSGTKISISKLKLTVTGQTEDTSGVSATYKLKLKYKGKTQESMEQATFDLKKVGGIWLISSSTIWEHLAGMVKPTPTATPSATPPPTATPTPAINPTHTLTPATISTLTPTLTSTPTPAPTPVVPSQTELPCRFRGTVKLNGANVPDGTTIRVTIAGDTYTSNTPSAYGASTYVIKIVPPAGTIYAAGTQVTFKIGNYAAQQTGSWEIGGNIQLDLTALSP
jgi:hypothetical protein